MKKSWFIMAPFVLVFAFLFVGCADDSKSEMDAKLSFNCASEIVMKYGTYLDEPAYAPLITNIDINDLSVDYNKNIINYDIETGMITANSSGETTLIVKSGLRVATVNVNVVTANYCTNLTLSKKYVVKLNQGACEKITPEVNQNYNMGFEFKSYDPTVATIDENGVITPLQKGTAIIEVVAKNGINELGYTYIYKTATVVVEDVATEFNIEILDKDLNPLELIKAEQGFDYYELYSGDNAPLYVLKYSSDISLKDKYLKIFNNNLTQNNSGENSRLFTYDVGEAGYQIQSSNEDGTVWYKPFYAVDSGIDFLQEILVDVALNYDNSIRSNLIKIKVYKSTTTFNVTPYYDEKLTEPINNTPNENIELVFTNNQALVYFDIKVNEYANTDFYFSDLENVEITRNTDNLVTVKFLNTGNYAIVFVPKDNLDLIKIFNFAVFEKEYCNEIVVAQTKLVLSKNEYQCVDFSVYNSAGEIEQENGGVIAVAYDINGQLVTDTFEFKLIFDNIYIKALKSGEYNVVLYNQLIDNFAIISIIVN